MHPYNASFNKRFWLHLPDTRDIDEKRRNNVIEKIHQSAVTIANTRKVTLSEFRIVNQDPPALSDESIVKAMEDASKALNLTYKLMISRAYHDSLFMARWWLLFELGYVAFSTWPYNFALPKWSYSYDAFVSLYRFSICSLLVSLTNAQGKLDSEQ